MVMRSLLDMSHFLMFLELVPGIDWYSGIKLNMLCEHRNVAM